MDQKEIDQIVTKVIDLLFEKMIASAPKKHVLVMFTGAGSGYKVGMQTIQWLAKASHPLTVIMTTSARQIIGEENVRKAGEVRIIGENEWVNTPKLVRELDLVLMPTLSMNTATHLALGLMDSLVTTLALGTLLAGKPVIAVCDGANPYGNGGRVFSKTNDTAPLLRAKLADNLTTLMDFGFQLVKEEEFLLRFINQLHSVSPQPTPVQAHSNQSNSSSAPLKTTLHASPGSLITATDLLIYPSGSTIRLSSGIKLTALALETAERQKLTLVYE